MQWISKKRNGFTLVEILVAVAILAILVAVVLASMNEARKKARDTQRVSDLKQIEVGARMYRDLLSTSTLPTAPNGEVFGDGVGFDTTIAPYLPKTLKDPLSKGSNFYYYDSSFDCNGVTHSVIMALAMERSGAANYTSVCGSTHTLGTSGTSTSANTYIVILK